MAKKTVHFTIAGDWLTERARDLMREERLDTALRVLDCVEGLTQDQRMDILNGRARLVGDSTAGLKLEAEPDAPPRQKNEVIDAVAHLRQQRDWAREETAWATELAIGRVVVLGSPTGARQAPVSACNARRTGLREDLIWDDMDPVGGPPGARKLTVYRDVGPRDLDDDEDDDDLVPRMVRSAAKAGSFALGPPVGGGLAAAQLMAAVPAEMKEAAGAVLARMTQQLEPDMVEEEKVLLIPEPTAKCGQSGWLSPDGKFYACPYWGHNELAYALSERLYQDPQGGTRELEKRGWVKFGWSAFDGTLHVLGFLDGAARPTKIQREMTFDFCAENKVALPFWLREEG